MSEYASPLPLPAFRVALAALVAASCGTTEQPHDTFVVADSAGLRVVENARPASGGDHPWARVEPEPSLEIGGVEGAEPYMFWPLEAALEAPSGDIVVVDGGTREIRVFDSAGKHLRTFGGKGEGPGEFGEAPFIEIAPPDTVVAWDAALRRVTWFALDGTVLGSRSLAGLPDAHTLPLGASRIRWRLHPDGTVVGQKESARDHGLDGLVEEPLALAILGRDARSLRWISDLPGHPSLRVGRVQVPAVLHPTAGGGNWDVRASPASIIVADDREGRWALSVYGFDGTLKASIRAAVPRHPVTDALAREARDWLLSRADYLPPEMRRDYRTAVQRIPLPDSTPAIAQVIVDAGNRVWARRWRGYWEEHGLDVYDVIDTDGRWLGSVEVPTSLGRILSIGDDHMLFAWPGPLDVPRVRRHRVLHVLEQPEQP